MYPAMPELDAECVPKSKSKYQQSRSEVVYARYKARVPYRSDSVMSRMVSHVSKPWSTNMPRYWERPSSWKIRSREVM